jgi:hypothetical protein
VLTIPPPGLMGLTCSGQVDHLQMPNDEVHVNWRRKQIVERTVERPLLQYHGKEVRI